MHTGWKQGPHSSVKKRRGHGPGRAESIAATLGSGDLGKLKDEHRSGDYGNQRKEVAGTRIYLLEVDLFD